MKFSPIFSREVMHEEPLFLAKDVADWIEYSKTGKGKYDTSRMLGTVDDEEKLVRTIFVSGQNREMWFLTEEGLYEVLMQSRKPIAKEFKKQVKAILKEVRQTGSYGTSATLSPQLQLLISMELEQNRQAEELEEMWETMETTVNRIDNMADVFSLNASSWRKDSQDIVKKIALAKGDYAHIQEVYREIYQLLEARAGVNLTVRANNQRKRMALLGATTTEQKKISKLDIIAADKKLAEIYFAIVKEMAIATGVCGKLEFTGRLHS